jgi:serine/threonine-protein kinase RIO1
MVYVKTPRNVHVQYRTRLLGGRKMVLSRYNVPHDDAEAVLLDLHKAAEEAHPRATAFKCWHEPCDDAR